ncbi:protein kinase domain-containing protein [Lyngbya aestuarii]|uniref:protein kinase domain-containing protein n=1 Tax=Lyngbya aestuarii TaxID=118322 RepID=UPI00403D76F9
MGFNLKSLFQPTNPEKPLGGRYQVISQLAAGGFGQTFKAYDLHLPGHPQCVVKQLKPQVSDAASLQTARRLFDTEAQVLYKLGDHEQIPRLLAHFEEQQEFYLAQELIEGEPLATELVAGQAWSESQVVALLQDILCVLAFVHQQQVIHRDIKPSNLMRRQGDGRIVLIDFGAVKQVSTQMFSPQSGQTNLTISIGTQGYMPKEQLGGSPRFSSDVYAVGMIGIQALTGTHPRLLAEDPQTGEVRWQERLESVTPELAEVLEKMVRYDFRARYGTAVEALAAIGNLPAALRESLAALPPLPPVSPQYQPPVSATATGKTFPVVESKPHSGVPPATVGAVGNPHHPASQGTTVAASGTGTSRKPLLNPGLVLVTLVTVGGSLWIAKSFLLPQSETTNPDQGTELAQESSGVKPVDKSLQESPEPAKTNSSTESPTSSYNEQPATEAAASPVVETDNASATVTPTATPVSPPEEQQAAQLLSEADSQREAGNYQQALKIYDQAIALQPDIPEAHWGRCYSLNSLGRVSEGISACDNALALKPNYPEALWSKGSALDSQQKYQEALTLYDQALQINPQYAQAWNNRGVALLNLRGDPQEAITAFEKATTLQPDFADAWANRGAALWAIQRFDEALESIDRALQIEPNNKAAKNLRKQMQKKLR